MKIALIRNSVNAVCVDGLNLAIRSAGHVSYILAEDRELPDQKQIIGKELSYRRNSLQFSSEVHRWLLQNCPHVVEAPYSNYPLLLEQIAGGTPTVVRYDPEYSDIDFDQSLHDNWTRHTLELSTVRAADVVVTSKESVAKQGKMICPMEVLPLGIQRPETLCRLYEDKPATRSGFVLYCPDNYLSFYKEEMKTISVDAHSISELESITDYSMFLGLKGVAVFSNKMCEQKILSILSTGCPVIHSHIGSDYSYWPVMWVDALSPESFKRLPSVLKLLDKRSKTSEECSQFAENYYWPNLVDQYVTVYQAAVKQAWRTGRVRGW